MINPLALEALIKGQRQLDQDGVEVGVSRQALDELIAEFNKIDAPPGWLTLADFLDPETAIDDRVLRAVHLDLETRGRKNADFMVTVHHRNIVLSAAARAVRKTPAADRISHLEAKLAKALEALAFYANPVVYKPHPHGLAFDRRDLSFLAKSVLEEMQ